MENLMIERFSVAGAQLVKIFGRRQDESKTFGARAKRVSDITATRTFYSRLFFSTLMLVTVIATAVTYGWGWGPRRQAKTRSGNGRGSRLLPGSPLWPDARAFKYSSQPIDRARFL